MMSLKVTRKESDISKPPRTKPPAPKRAAPPASKKDRITSTKKFTVAPWTGEGEGEKIILYGRSGIGKTTLASMTPNPFLIGLDDGGRKIRNPKTGKSLRRVPEIETFEDVRAALQSSVFDDCGSIVIDTITEMQTLGLQGTFNRVSGPKGSVAQSIEDYGYNKGYRHWLDTMRLVLTDCDRHIRAGRNVVMLSQRATRRKANASGEDYLMEVPDLYNGKDVSILDAYIAWADHVLRVDYSGVIVGDDKKISSSAARAVYVHPEAHFEAKSRTISVEYDVVEFNEPADSSIWRLIFNDE